jgi:hypothetical protein
MEELAEDFDLSHHRHHHSGLFSNRLVRAFAVLLLIGVTVEGYRAYTFYRDATAARDSLLAAQKDLDVTHMADTEAQVRSAKVRILSQRCSRAID